MKQQTQEKIAWAIMAFWIFAWVAFSVFSALDGNPDPLVITSVLSFVWALVLLTD